MARKRPVHRPEEAEQVRRWHHEKLACSLFRVRVCSVLHTECHPAFPQVGEDPTLAAAVDAEEVDEEAVEPAAPKSKKKKTKKKGG